MSPVLLSFATHLDSLSWRELSVRFVRESRALSSFVLVTPLARSLAMPEAPQPPTEPTENAVRSSVLPPASSSDSAPPLAPTPQPVRPTSGYCAACPAHPGPARRCPSRPETTLKARSTSPHPRRTPPTRRSRPSSAPSPPSSSSAAPSVQQSPGSTRSVLITLLPACACKRAADAHLSCRPSSTLASSSPSRLAPASS